MDAIITYLLENVPWFVAVMFVGWAMWRLSKYHSKLEETQTTVSKLPCAERKAEMEEIKSFKKSFDSMADRFEEVCKWIMRFDADAIDSLAPKHSPRKMNDMGLEVYSETGAKQVIDNNAQLLLADLEKKSPGTAYDVEEGAFEVLLAHLQDPLFNPLKNYLYSSPSRVIKKDESGEEKVIELSMGLMLRLMSIDLRDRYLESHPMM